MRIIRFDPEVALRERAGEQGLRRATLTAPGPGAQAAWLGAGTSVRRVAEQQVVLALLAGEAWVGVDRRVLPVGYGAVWEPGEECCFGAEEAAVGVLVEGEAEVWALSVTKPIELHEHDPAWSGWFAQLHARLWPHVQDVAVRVEHVGSTAVADLAAKPIIDLDVVVGTAEDVPVAIARLEAAGYRWRGDLGVPGREAFAPPAGEDLPPHHLYLVVNGSRPHLDHVLLRDLLRDDPEARRGYAELKRRNLELAGDDMDVYVAAKAALVAELLARARAEKGHPPVEYWRPSVAGLPAPHAEEDQLR